MTAITPSPPRAAEVPAPIDRAKLSPAYAALSDDVLQWLRAARGRRRAHGEDATS
jgi:hypothetical protein